MGSGYLCNALTVDSISYEKYRHPRLNLNSITIHDDVIKWKQFLRYWPFVRRIHRSPVSGEFPSQRPVTRSFDVFFDLRLNKLSSKQSWGWWFEMPSWSLWRHCDVIHTAVNKLHLKMHKLTAMKYLRVMYRGEHCSAGVKAIMFGIDDNFYEDSAGFDYRKTLFHASFYVWCFNVAMWLLFHI